MNRAPRTTNEIYKKRKRKKKKRELSEVQRGLIVEAQRPWEPGSVNEKAVGFHSGGFYFPFFSFHIFWGVGGKMDDMWRKPWI
jgi:hypothetical protein